MNIPNDSGVLTGKSGSVYMEIFVTWSCTYRNFQASDTGTLSDPI